MLHAAMLLAAALPGVAAAQDSRRPDVFEERILCQQAIEGVYARHRTGSPGSRAVPPETIRRKAMDPLLKSAALERLWGVRLTGAQLQAELDRMASHSQAPDTLRELWAALGDDPRLAAECLARPALADRLIRSYYAFDQRVHGPLKDRARADRNGVGSVEDLRSSSGVYSEAEWRLGRDMAGAPRATVLDADTFEARVRELRRALGADRSPIALGRPTPVREDQTRFYVVAALVLEPERVRTATVEWRKETFDSWWERTRGTIEAATDPLTFRFAKPEIAAATPCVDDTWRPTLHLLDPRYWHTAVWTGSEMIVFGGMQSVGTYYDDGSRYDPATDTWTLLPDAGAPSARQAHVAVWTGSDMIVWGSTFDGGALYDPAANAWRPMSVVNEPPARSDASVVWTGTEMIVWGGEMVNSGGRYNPTTDTWTILPPAPLAPRAYHSAVWTGTQMIVWGGYNPHIGQMYGDGARYNPATNAWTSVTAAGAPNMRYWHTAVWTGTEMIVWGGINYPVYDLSGGRYDPVTDTWTPTSMVNAPSLRWMHMAVWTGSEMIVQGGTPGAPAGGRYRPSTDTWTSTNPLNAANNGQGITAVWTGTEMIVWGGLDDDFVFHNDGARYNPATDSWLRTSTMNVPTARGLHAAVWTGAEMMIWGGNQGDNAGGLYDPATDTWRRTSTTGAPFSRQNATAVWTGQEAIFWGGGQSWTDPGTGGRYDVASDSWAAVSVVNAPNDRYGHSAIWTGTEMIVFGGIGTLNDAKRYRPATDTWTDSTTTNAPGERDHHAAVWTGTEMIIWGGFINAGLTPTGGRYRPDTDTWTPTNVTDSPETRMWPVGVWTGTEMIVWGGHHWLWGGDRGDGARYRPADDTWTVTTLVGAPTPRIAQGVWTGSEMLLWGGANNSSGGRYDPSSDSWRATTLTNAPHVRYGGRWSTVWTGSEMIIWGGIIETQEGGRYCANPLVPLPDITVTPTPVDFGTVLVGGAAERTLTVRNDGNAPLAITAVAPPLAPFSIVTDGCTGTSLPPAATCAVLARFAPASVGGFSGQIAVSSNDPDEPQVTAPLQGTGVTLALDAAALSVLDASGNGVWEPGETTAVVTAWRNTGAIAASSVTGTATASAGITLVDPTAAYGTIGAGATVSCDEGGDCVDATATGPRPAAHWDAVLSETLSSAHTHDWTLHVGASFADVAPASPFYPFVETVLHRSVTGGCSASEYCPSLSTTREQMAVFVLVAKEGAGYVPPACQPGLELFDDVPASSPFCRWVEELARRGVVTGCGAGNYCPASAVTREQMAIFLLRVLDPALSPPACGTPMFDDVPAASPFCRWVEELARRGVTGGCSSAPPLYCPTAPVTRDQMAAFTATTFDLRLYVP